MPRTDFARWLGTAAPASELRYRVGADARWLPRLNLCVFYQNPYRPPMLSHKSQIRLRERIPANQLCLIIREGQQLHSLGRSEDFAARHRFCV